MKKALIIVAVAVCVLLIRNHMSMSQDSIEQYLQTFSLKSAQNPQEACDMVDDKIKVSIIQQTPTETVEVKGGKTELCNLMEQSRAAMVALQGNLDWHYENVQVKSSFPWQKANVSYDEISTVSAAQIGSYTTKMRYQIQVKRPLFGDMVVTKLQATGSMVQ